MATRPIEGEQSKTVQAADVIDDHMFKFAFEGGTSGMQDAIKDLNMPGKEHNRSVLTQMQSESGQVRNLFRVRALPQAESAQQRVVGFADQLDVKSLSADFKRLSDRANATTDPQQKKQLEFTAAAFGMAAASPFIERARLGAIQLRQGGEGAAERSFAAAIKTGVPDASLGFENIRQLYQAVVERHEELKVKRTLPEVFQSNIDWMDSQNKDGRADMSELRAAAGNTKNITAKTLVGYLMKNYDNIDQGLKGIDAEDIRRHWEGVKPTELKAF